MTERAPLSSKGGPYRLGIIGDPVAHSLSPALQQPALDQVGIPATYERWHTTADEIEARFESLRQPAVLGANVTVPHKLAALRLSDEVSPAAARAGAVNTVVNRDGMLFGDNTDIAGFAVSLKEAAAGHIPETVLVLGAGGAARAVVLALEELGAAEIIVANRDLERATKLANDLAPAPVRTTSLEERDLVQELPSVDLLVNATSLGWHKGETPLDLRLLDRLPREAIVADLTYRDTDLLVAASARSLQTLDGLAMLVHQGARAFELFTGYAAPVATMLAAARRARDGT
jgi:shikimate dehydrogenase